MSGGTSDFNDFFKELMGGVIQHFEQAEDDKFTETASRIFEEQQIMEKWRSGNFPVTNKSVCVLATSSGALNLGFEQFFEQLHGATRNSFNMVCLCQLPEGQIVLAGVCPCVLPVVENVGDAAVATTLHVGAKRDVAPTRATQKIELKEGMVRDKATKGEVSKPRGKAVSLRNMSQCELCRGQEGEPDGQDTEMHEYEDEEGEEDETDSKDIEDEDESDFNFEFKSQTADEYDFEDEDDFGSEYDFEGEDEDETDPDDASELLAKEAAIALNSLKDATKESNKISKEWKSFDLSMQGPLSKEKWKDLLEPRVVSNNSSLSVPTYCVPIYGEHRRTETKYHAVYCIPKSEGRLEAMNGFLLDASLQIKLPGGLYQFEEHCGRKSSKKPKKTLKIDLCSGDKRGKPLELFLNSIQ